MGATREDLAVMDPQGMVDGPNDLVLTVQGKMLAKFVATILQKHYPGWRWGITVDEKGGVIHLFVLELSGDLGYTLLLDDVYGHGNFDFKIILMAGGELLERYGLPARGKTPDWSNYVTWQMGIAVPDVTDKAKGIVAHMARRLGAEG